MFVENDSFSEVLLSLLKGITMHRTFVAQLVNKGFLLLNLSLKVLCFHYIGLGLFQGHLILRVLCLRGKRWKIHRPLLLMHDAYIQREIVSHEIIDFRAP